MTAPVRLLSCCQCSLTFAHEARPGRPPRYCSSCVPRIPRPHTAADDERDGYGIDETSPAYRLVARLAHLEAAAVLAVAAICTGRWQEARDVLTAVIGDPRRHDQNRAGA